MYSLLCREPPSPFYGVFACESIIVVLPSSFDILIGTNALNPTANPLSVSIPNPCKSVALYNFVRHWPETLAQQTTTGTCISIRIVYVITYS